MPFYNNQTRNNFPTIPALFLLLFFLVAFGPSPAFGGDKQSRKLWKSLTYLKSVPEISWIEVDGKNIILGWNGYPPNFSRINRTAAKKVSRKVRGEIKVYSVKEHLKGWRPKKDALAHLCHSLGEGGRLKFTNCR
ncbi:MAG: hypothetical protein G3M70_01365 [Candidatus Nitronauta litoralis]|uniref:Uncharacterized protein n=1 Tax=Candidatus Nitronauta litoralis TaxID=2705533 RepID=A0A7T0FYJ9_9BACT|nr:MAG: hypothetical protein G3M70_01365 [Candidatus Nitronauta litoralis]